MRNLTVFRPVHQENFAKNLNHSPDASKNSVFIFPGIDCASETMETTAEKLYELSGQQRPIYAYNEPLLDNELNYPPEVFFSFEQHINEIKEGIKEHHKAHPNDPIILIGFSFSCLLALASALALKKENNELDVFLYLIDAPAPIINQQYYQQQSNQSIQDLIRIVNFVANKSCLKLSPSLEWCETELSASSIKLINIIKSKATVDEQVDFLYEETLKANKTTDQDFIEEFTRFITVIKRNLNYLVYDAPNKLHPENHAVTSLRLFSINSTQEKYKHLVNDNYLGWSAWADPSSLSKNDSTLVADAEHIDLIKDNEFNAILAKDINDFIKNNLTNDYLKQYLAIQTLKNNKSLLQEQQQILEQISDSLSPVLQEKINKGLGSINENIIKTIDDILNNFNDEKNKSKARQTIKKRTNYTSLSLFSLMPHSMQGEKEVRRLRN